MKSDRKPEDRLCSAESLQRDNVAKWWVTITTNTSDNCKTKSSLTFLVKLSFLPISLTGAGDSLDENRVDLSYFSFHYHPLIPPLSSGLPS